MAELLIQDQCVTTKDINDLIAGKTVHMRVDAQGDYFDSDDDDDYNEEQLKLFDEACENWKKADFAEKSFDELRADMQDIGNGIYKKVILEGFGELIPEENAKVTLMYSVFFENTSIPIDSTLFQGRQFHFITGAKVPLLLGIYQSVMSMKIQEQAQFIIPCRLLYGEIGAPPRVPPNKDGLLLARVVNVEPACGIDQDAQEYEVKTYESVKKRAEELRVKARNAFNFKKFNFAIRSYHEAVKILENVDTIGEEQDDERNVLVARMLINVGMIYNKQFRPQNACTRFNEAQRYFHKIPNELKGKLLLHKGRSLRNLGDHDRALKCLHDAQKYSNAPEIGQELSQLISEKKKADNEMAQMMQKALNFKNNAATAQKAQTISCVNRDFEKNFKQTIEQFCSNEKITKQMVAENVTKEQRAIMDRILDTEEYKNISLQTMPLENSIKFCLVKNIENTK
ncbi:hypothetical protein DMENIID0001_031960 [Sergentomyia squamirostris]